MRPDGEPGLSKLGEALATRKRRKMAWPGFRPAAILVPILQCESGPELLFTVRASTLNHHAGQIAFPGGRVDPGESVAEAAIRETFEETGLNVGLESLIGYLDDLPSPARYIATPVVAVLPWPQPLRLNPDEVDEVFTVPLRELSGLAPRTEPRLLEGKPRKLYFYPWGERMIWGLTGNVLKNLLDYVDS